MPLPRNAPKGSKCVGRKRGRPSEASAPPTEQQKETIATLFARNWSQAKIAQHTGVSTHHVGWVMLGKGLTFADRYPGRQFPKSKVTEAQKEAMVKMFDQGSTHAQIAQRLQLCTLTVLRVLHIRGRRRNVQKKITSSSARSARPRAEAQYRQSPEIEERAPVPCNTNGTSKPADAKHNHRDNKATTAMIHPFFPSSGTEELDGTLPINTETVEEDSVPNDKADTMPLRMVVSCHGSVFRCETCQLDWKTVEQFVSHLLRSDHGRLETVWLACTGCRFKTRKPMKVIAHALKNQTRSATMNDINAVDIALQEGQ